MDIKKKYLWVHDCVGTHTAWAFEIEYIKTYLFPSKIGSSIPRFRDTHLHLLLSKNFFLQLLAWFWPVSCANILNLQLSWGIC